MPEPLLPIKHSRLGIASFISATLAVVIVLGDIAVITLFQSRHTLLKGLNAMDSIVTCFTPLLTLVGVGLGVISIDRREPKRVFGVLGLVFNGLFLLTVCVLYAIRIFTMMRVTGA